MDRLFKGLFAVAIAIFAFWYFLSPVNHIIDSVTVKVTGYGKNDFLIYLDDPIGRNVSGGQAVDSSGKTTFIWVPSGMLDVVLMSEKCPSLLVYHRKDELPVYARLNVTKDYRWHKITNVNVDVDLSACARTVKAETGYTWKIF